MEDLDLRKLLMKIGISSNIQGFHYILEAVRILRKQNTHISMMKLYKIISTKFPAKSASSIERAIRHAIGKAYKKNNTFKKIYLSIPDNSAFLYDLVFNFDIFISIVKE